MRPPFFLMLPLVVLAGCAAEPPSKYELRKMSAAQATMSCDELRLAMHRNQQILERQFGASEARTAASAGSTASTLISVPYLGRALGLAGSAASSEMKADEVEAESAYNAQFQAYADKGCSPTLQYGQPIPGIAAGAG